MGGGLESRCVGRVYGADGAVHGTIRNGNTHLTMGSTVMYRNYGNHRAY